MKRSLYLLLSVVFFVQLGGCATLDKLTQPAAKADNSAGATPLPPYNGPKARIAVADFDVKAAKATGEIGTGLREMLVTALVNGNRFRVVERPQLNPVMQEQELAASGAAPSGNSAQRSQIKTADLLVTAAVTEFEPQSSGGAGGIGGGGGVGSGIMGGLLGASVNKAHMALDIRILDASTSQVLASTRVQGQATDIAGGFMAGFFGGWSLGAGLGAYANTPMEKAIRICIIEGVRYISQTIPAGYYKY